MASKPLNAIGRVIFWRYKRGGWQYDILCGLILLFIFLTPKSVFDGSYFSGPKEEQVQEQPVAAPEGEIASSVDPSEDAKEGQQ